MAVSSKRVRYTGRVQGVGFRYTVQHLAENFPVSGYVRNLADGSVEVVAAGAAEDVQEFLTAIEQRMAHYIVGKEVADEPGSSYVGFRIRY